MSGGLAQSIRRFGFLTSLVFLLAVAAVTPGNTQTASKTKGSARAHRPIIVFETDFGTANDAVAICKAVILSIAPDAQIMDITHQVTPFSVADGARFLYEVTPYYPAGTVFLVVVDPGVGTSRKAVVVKSKRGQYFVLPDNGLITSVANRDGLVSAREITNPGWMIGGNVSSTFHGRDIFSPTAAHLAKGWDWTTVGPVVPLDELVRFEPSVAKVDASGITGEVIALDDPFGGLITDISGDQFRSLGYRLGNEVTVRVGDREFTMPFVKTFMDVPVGRMLAYIDSRGRFGLALNEKNLSKTYSINPPTPIFVPRKGK